MKFTEDKEILEIIKNPKNAQGIQKGRNYESRLRLFTEVKFEEDLKNGDFAYKEFKAFMTGTLRAQKALRVLQFLQFPLSSVAITESMLSELYRVFNAGNAYFSVETVKKRGGEEMQQLLVDVDLVGWIEDVAKDCLKNKPNTAIVVDKGEDGKPYLIAVGNDRMWDIDLKENQIDCEYIAFVHSVEKTDSGKETRYSLYDEEQYHVILEKDGDYKVESSAPHGMGYCPARMFLVEPLNSSNEYPRKNPLSSSLSKLREWQYFDLFKFFIDHEAPFPVTEMQRSKCGNDKCVKWWIVEEHTYYDTGERKTMTKRTKCKTCEENHAIGVGTVILLDPVEDPQDKGAAGKFKVHEKDVTSLDYVKKKLADIVDYVTKKVVGVDEVPSKEAVNEKQMTGAFESRTNVLLSIKTNLEDVYVWAVETMADAYIPEQPLAVHADFGTEWYLVSDDNLQDRFDNAKKAGLPRVELDMIYSQIIDKKYKTNPDKAETMKMINSLDECPYDTQEERLDKYKEGIISQQELIISSRISTFVRKFERENGKLIDFAANMKPHARHDKILSILKKYADETIRENQAQQAGSGEGADE